MSATAEHNGGEAHAVFPQPRLAKEAVLMYSRIVEQKGLKCAALPPEWK